MMPILRGEKTPLRRYLHGEHTWGVLSNHYVTDGRFKYIWFSQSGVEQLFDTQNDLYELHDLVDLPQHAQTVERLRQILIKELTGREEGYTDGQKLIVGREGGKTLGLAGKKKSEAGLSGLQGGTKS